MSNNAKDKARETFSKIDQSLPVDLNKVANYFHIRIEKKDMEDSVSGMLITDKDSAVIVINSSQAENRQRFTIAHELGHFRLHHEANSVFVDNTNVFYRSKNTGSSKKEIEANVFAAEILMPESLIKEEFNKTESSVFDDKMAESLAEKFGVSSQALTYRLLNLGLIHA